jgi:predicted peptidase
MVRLAALLGLSMAAAQRDDWDSLWWLPTEGEPTPGKQVAVSSRLPHLLYLPDEPSAAPLLVFLHGQGESSPAPLPMVALQGPPQTAGRNPKALPFAVLSPQKPRSSEFFDDDVASEILGLIDTYVSRFGLDATRVYLTGVSQGGIGTWNLAARHPGRFAAIAPVAGGLRRPKAGAAALAATPIWAFHGANDVVLPVSMSDRSVEACNALAARAAEPAKYTRVPEAPGRDPSWGAAGIPDMPGHGGMCEVAYYPPDGSPPPLYAWLLSHRRDA